MSDTFAFVVGTLPFLWQGLLMTLFVSLIVVICSLLLGLLVGVAFAYASWWLTLPLRAASDILRGTPLLVVIFSIYYLLPFVGFNLQPLPAFLLALTLFKTAHVGEIARGAIQSIAKGQTDAGKAIGLTFPQRLLYVIFPQAVRRFLPPWINSVTDAVKGSSLISLVGVVDLMLAAQQVIGRTYEPLPIYLLAAAMYFVINYCLSVLSRRLEARYAYIRE
ncbi:amino acid ABC transporter permease [Terrarubrum flagellatum]|uniref:amino acid ABC transporter permease n=1 Tax=Terrirubrum flagellatum TaxID=2895980 RepID=UPI003144D39C